jgi:hypothetical protein
MNFFFFCANFFTKVKKLNWLHIPYFWGKNHQILFFFKTSILFCHISFDLDSNLGHFLSSFSLFGQVLETCHHLMLNPLGMLTIDATSENWGGKGKKKKKTMN